MSIPSAMFGGIGEGALGTTPYRSNMPQNGSEGEPNGGNGSGFGSGQSTPIGIGMGKGLGMGKGKGIGIGMGKGGKGSIASMGFSHPSHRLALLSGQAHQTLPPSKIALKMRTAREEEAAQATVAAAMRDVADKEAEAVRQGQLQVIDREQQVAHAAAQSAASAARLVRQRPIYSQGSTLYQGGGFQGGGTGPMGGMDMSPRSMGSTAAALLHHSSPPSIHLHHPGGLTRIGSQNHLPQPAGNAVPSSLGYSMTTYNTSSQPEKDGYVKPMTASAVLTAAMGRVSAFFAIASLPFICTQYLSLVLFSMSISIRPASPIQLTSFSQNILLSIFL